MDTCDTWWVGILIIGDNRLWLSLAVRFNLESRVNTTPNQHHVFIKHILIVQQKWKMAANFTSLLNGSPLTHELGWFTSPSCALCASCGCF